MKRSAAAIPMPPEEVRLIRKELGLSQAQLAILLVTSRSTVSRWEGHGPHDRSPPALSAQALRWFAAGFRPPEWPTEKAGVNRGRHRKYHAPPPAALVKGPVPARHAEKVRSMLARGSDLRGEEGEGC